MTVTSLDAVRQEALAAAAPMFNYLPIDEAAARFGQMVMGQQMDGMKYKFAWLESSQENNPDEKRITFGIILTPEQTSRYLSLVKQNRPLVERVLKGTPFEFSLCTPEDVLALTVGSPQSMTLQQIEDISRRMEALNALFLGNEKAAKSALEQIEIEAAQKPRPNKVTKAR